MGILPAYCTAVVTGGPVWNQIRFGIEYHRVGIFPAPEFWIANPIERNLTSSIEITMVDKITGENIVFPREYELHIQNSLGARTTNAIDAISASFNADVHNDFPAAFEDPTPPNAIH